MMASLHSFGKAVRFIMLCSIMMRWQAVRELSFLVKVSL